MVAPTRRKAHVADAILDAKARAADAEELLAVSDGIEMMG